MDKTIVAPDPVRLGADDGGAVALRRFPYPYRAMMAICSDLDETPNRRVYWDIARFLNQTEPTPMGLGVGLEVGNSMYFDMPPDQFAYWNTDDAGRSMVRALIGSGHIDCFHSFGDLAITRKDAARALGELSRHGCRLEVWIDHGVAPSNFGADIMQGRGDVPGADVFHADLTCAFGVRYVWRGRVTSVIGQDTPRDLSGVWVARHPFASAKTVGKEMLKGFLARSGNEKYAVHRDNRVLTATRLRSGHAVWEFLRANPHWGGVSCGETADGLADVLVQPMLETLLEREGVMVLYTHLGKVRDPAEPFNVRTREALRRLAHYVRERRILVATTRRLLGYCQMQRDVTIESTRKGDQVIVKVTTRQPEESPDALQGLTLYVARPERTCVMINGRDDSDFTHNPPDHTGRPSISLPWLPLTFPRWS